MVVAPPLLPAQARPRLDSIDFVRGAVMVLMMLDHMRDFTHEAGFTGDPLDPATTTPLLYFTRWITHLCAPTFVFLAGLGAGLQRLRGKPVAELSHFLWTRGLWLVFLELTVVRSAGRLQLPPVELALPAGDLGDRRRHDRALGPGAGCPRERCSRSAS